jgi:hypothetical protein
VARLIVSSWKLAYRDVLPSAVLDGLDPADRVERWRARLTDQDEAGQVLVAAGSEGLLGVTWFGAARQHPIHPAPPDSGEIVAFYLELGCFGTGLSHRLAAEAEAWLAARFERSILWVLEGNARARRFYTRRGWLADGARAPYPRPGCRGVYVVRHRWG